MNHDLDTGGKSPALKTSSPLLPGLGTPCRGSDGAAPQLFLLWTEHWYPHKAKPNPQCDGI